MSASPISAIPSKDEFDSLPKLEKKMMLEQLRKVFDDKEIRDTWGIKPQSYYQMIHRYGLGRPRKANANKEPLQPMAESPVDVERGEYGEKIPSDRRWPRSNVLDAEFTVVEDTAPKRSEPKAPGGITFPFPVIKGTPAQIRKQFEGITLFLEGHEDENTRFEIRVSVVRG